MNGKQAANREEPRHPIQVVSRRTGVTQDSLRAWEKRYRAVEPHRAPGGRRLYSDADIERLLLLRRATDAGRRIGQVAPLATAELRDIVRQDEEAMARAPHSPGGGPGAAQPDADSHLAACLQAAESMDAERLHAQLSLARAELSLPALLEQVLTPMLEMIGEQWLDGTGRVAQEHLVSSVVRSLLSPQATAGLTPRNAPTVVISTPAGQVHELGALMAAVTAAADGWRVAYLGPDLPAEEIANAARRSDARALLLSLIYPADDPDLPDELRRARALLGEEVIIIVGGRAAPAYASALAEIQARTVASLPALRKELSTLRFLRV
jgi:DNA-binding transcriptional MerR regulator/methylmalonyl-CoA mutase cobalamin-binding subunit